jgi:hypothetical protein
MVVGCISVSANADLSMPRHSGPNHGRRPLLAAVDDRGSQRRLLLTAPRLIPRKLLLTAMICSISHARSITAHRRAVRSNFASPLDALAAQSHTMQPLRRAHTRELSAR